MTSGRIRLPGPPVATDERMLEREKLLAETKNFLVISIAWSNNKVHLWGDRRTSIFLHLDYTFPHE